MRKIIKKGTRDIRECDSCGCLFSFDKEDVKTNLVTKHVKCPQCACPVNVDVFKEITCDFCNDFESKPDSNHLYKHPDGRFIIMADTGDSFQWGTIEDVKYCPYCGRRLEDD